jgi:hypothetical protein
MESINTITTLAFFAGFLNAPASTYNGDWLREIKQTPRSKLASPTNDLISPSVNPAPSEQLTAAFVDTLPPLDRLSCLELDLEMYGELNDGWDGPNSRVPTKADIQKARSIVAKLPPGLPIPKPMLSAAGVVGMYWDTKSVFADIELDADGCLSLFTRCKTGNMEEVFEEDIDINSLTSEWFKTRLAVLLDA